MTSQKLEEYLERHHVRATILMGLAMYMLIDVARWGMLFAATSKFQGLETAAIIAAAQAPAALFAGWVFKIYAENRSTPPN